MERLGAELSKCIVLTRIAGLGCQICRLDSEAPVLLSTTKKFGSLALSKVSQYSISKNKLIELSKLLFIRG